MIIYSCENCGDLFWSKTTLSNHQISEHITIEGYHKTDLNWRRYEIKVINKSKLNYGLGYDKSVGMSKYKEKKLKKQKEMK